MENYIVSARKYRPITFDTVVGQNALTTTLKNAIAGGKLAHAYLFCGPRGVGKTTCARIFARTINCLHPTADGEACNQCESCLAFNEQRSYNIHELDAASNNSVEDIRSLIEQVRIPPQIGKYKVFIIDEVHMLSAAAFNAFLKTLEEPPHHAIFILATTEKHKILPTILSRCQIYDFNRMGVNDTVNHLKFVAEKEGIEVEPEALNVIAQKADGGMRDALSIFDQVVSFTGGRVTYLRVIETLNVLDYDYYFKVTDFLLENKVTDCLLLLNEILNRGFDGHHFINGLASHLRDLLVSRDASTLSLLEVSDSVRSRYAEQAKRCTPKFLYRAIKLCNDCDLNYRTSKNKRLLVEITLIQAAQLTGDEADEYCGRSPQRTLKPIFSKQVTPQQQTDNQQQNNKPVQTESPVVTSPKQQVPHQTSEMRTPVIGKAKESKPGVPIVKQGSISVSIRNREVKQESAAIKPIQEKETLQSVTPEVDRPFNEYDLQQGWYRFASLLPVEETAMAGRLKDMQPKLTDGANFEVAINNNLVLNSITKLKPRIEEYLRDLLKNRKITMHTRLYQETERKKAYGRVEQFKMMTEKNPTLLKLKERFDLELN